MVSEFLKIGPRISVLPIVHGSGDFALEVRRVMLSQRFDCVAVPLPPSFQHDVERAVGSLPGISVVTQAEPVRFRPDRDGSEFGESLDFGSGEERDESDDDNEGSDDGDERRCLSYVPIDPCQGVIMALRVALQERLPRAFIDVETEFFEPVSAVLPDPYALKKVALDKFAAAVLPKLPRPGGNSQQRRRVAAMAFKLRRLERTYKSILFVCSIMDWPWVREAYRQQAEDEAQLSAGAAPSVVESVVEAVAETERLIEDDEVEATAVWQADPQTLLFLLGELPFITGLYERARQELDDDENLSVDGIKELLLTTRKRYQQDLKGRARKITPHMLAVYLRYIRNLSLIESRMTPDLYTLIIGAQQIAGDGFAIHLAETAREYLEAERPPWPTLSLGIGQGRLPDGDIVALKNRLPGPPVSWRTCRLQPKPQRTQMEKWKRSWNPFGQCSWPPEDVAIEKFRTHVKDHALSILGNDLARSEKFTTSLLDGLDIRETLRNSHTGDLYVKVLPPSRGKLDCVVMLFDAPADPRDYPWRVTWMAEHHDESTLALFATDFRQQMVGPGIGLATYGGALFLFPPRPVPDIWSDRRLDFATTLEERLVAAGCLHSDHRHIAILSISPPGPAWRRLAKRYGKKLLHVPLNHFSQETVQQLRIVHVLNGHYVRSFAAEFIRKA